MLITKKVCVQLLFALTILWSNFVSADSYPFAWTQQTPATNPGHRNLASLTYDPTTGKLILFGGFSGTALNDTWAYNGNATPPTWTLLAPTSSPPVRFGAMMTFEPSTGRVILFGGYNGSTFFSDTWAFDSAATPPTWTQLTIGTPTARYRGDMTFDACSGNIILFGGGDSLGNYLNDTWSFNPNTNTWTELLPANPPLGRIGSSLVFDPTNGKNVLFGGENAYPVVVLNDTWTYDSASNVWTELTVANPPPARQSATMDFDQANGQIILFGGANTSFQDMQDTWSFDTTSNTWTDLTPLNPPPARDSAVMAFDPSTGQIILYGGEENSAFLTDTWAYGISSTTVDWENLNPTASPSPRYLFNMTYDSCSGTNIFFGGVTTGNTLTNDTWSYDAKDNSWTQMLPLGVPPGRASPAIGFDPSSGNVVLFGGQGTLGELNDTWLYNSDGNTWTNVSPALSPPIRAGAGFTFDPCTGRMILFGGNSSGNTYLNDTWAFDAQATPPTWTNITPATNPPVRTNPAMDFDPNSGRTIMFSGSVTAGPLDDTWALNTNVTPVTWTLLAPPLSPPARNYGRMVFDPSIGRLVLFGGTDNITWAFNGKNTTWTALTTAHAPSTRIAEGLAFNPSVGQVILFGGNSTGTIDDDTWAFGVSYIPEVTSLDDATFTEGMFSSFLVNTNAFPISTIIETGILPAGVNFVDNGNGTGTLSGTPASGTEGNYPIVFSATNSAGTGIQNFSFTVAKIVTATNLAVSPNPAVPEQLVTLTVTVSPATATGTVTFFDGPTVLAVSPLTNGTASFATSFAPGSHDLEAVYSGDTNNATSTSETVVLLVESVFPPTNLKGVQKPERFLTQTDYVNVLTWNPPVVGNVAIYLIFRDAALHHLIGEIPGNNRLTYKDHDRTKGVTYTYYVISVDAAGNRSSPAVVTVKPRP